MIHHSTDPNEGAEVCLIVRTWSHGSWQVVSRSQLAQPVAHVRFGVQQRTWICVVATNQGDVADYKNPWLVGGARYVWA